VKKVIWILVLLTISGLNSIPGFSQIAGTRSVRVGELWQTDEDIPSGGWQISYNWPGNHWADKINGPTERETMLANGCARMAGMSCGLRDWKDRRNTAFPYVVYTVSSSIICHTANQIGGENIWMKVILRRKPPCGLREWRVESFPARIR